MPPKVSQERKAHVLAVLAANNGNYSRTSRETGCDRDAIKRWDEERKRQQREAFDAAWEEMNRDEPQSITGLADDEGIGPSRLSIAVQGLGQLWSDSELKAIKILNEAMDNLPVKSWNDARSIAVIAGIARDKHADLTLGRRKGEIHIGDKTLVIRYEAGPVEKGGTPQAIGGGGGVVGPLAELSDGKSEESRDVVEGEFRVDYSEYEKQGLPNPEEALSEWLDVEGV